MEPDSLADDSNLDVLSGTSSEERIQDGLHAVKREMEETTELSQTDC